MRQTSTLKLRITCGYEECESSLALKWDGKPLAEAAGMLCLLLAVCNCEWLPAVLLTRPFCSLRRWNPQGEIETVPPPSSAELPQWPRHLFCPQLDIINDDMNSINDREHPASLRFSATPYCRRTLGLSSAIQVLCNDCILMAHVDEGDLFLAITEARKEEIIEQISPQHHLRLWLDLLRLIMYAYPDPYAESSGSRVRWCCRDIITSTVLPLLSIVSWRQLEEGDFTMSNCQRLVEFLLYRSIVDDQGSSSWIDLQPELMDRLLSDHRLGDIARYEIGLLRCGESLVRSNIDGQKNQLLDGLWQLDRTRVSICRLRGILWKMTNPSMRLDESGAFSTAFREMIRPSQRYEDYVLSTFERCMNILTSSDSTNDPNIEFLACQHDVHVRSAIAFELMGRKRFMGAYMLLHSIFKQVETEYHRRQSGFFPVVIELIKCCNFIGREPEGETIARNVLDHCVDSENREQACNLQIVLVDSLIGQKKYERAEDALLMAMQSGHTSAYTYHLANLRLNKIKRRLGTLRTLELFGGLGEVDINLHDRSRTAAVKDEYFDELSASLSCTSYLQTLDAASENSVRAIQGLLLKPNARENRSVLTQIALHTKYTERKSSVQVVDQIAKQVSQTLSTATRPRSSDELGPVAQRLFETQDEKHDIPSGEKPQQRSHLDTPSSSKAVHLKSGNMFEEPGSLRQPLSVMGDSFKGVSSADRGQLDLEALQQQPHAVPDIGDRWPRLPELHDFPPWLQVHIIPHKRLRTIRHVVVLLHDYGGSELSLAVLAKRLHKQQPCTCFVLLRGLEAINSPSSGYHWGDPTNDLKKPFSSSKRVLIMIKSSIISECGFSPRNIVLMGHGQGGMVILATAAIWQDIELGGAVLIGGSPPSHLRKALSKPAPSSMIQTPVLVIGGALGDLDPLAIDSIKSRFKNVDTYIFAGGHVPVPDTDESIKRLVNFLNHRLQRHDEWNQKAIVSFDGGGVRTYGSLLILQELMNKIGDQEKRLNVFEGTDATTASSFDPCPYKPTISKSQRASSGSSSTLDSCNYGTVVPSRVSDLPNSSLYLPCHYFDYAIGTSTGGLISIMLSRLRMTVDDCIAEYKVLCRKLFGNPRPLTFRRGLWSKFEAKVLIRCMRSISARYSEAHEKFELVFPLDEDLCKTIVMAFVERKNTEEPYFFRTYYKLPAEYETELNGRNHGPPLELRLWEIAWATLAAPRCFPPITIRDPFTDKAKRGLRFKDGGLICNNPSVEACFAIMQKKEEVRPK